MKELNGLWDYRDPYIWMDKVQKGGLPPLIIQCAITGGVQGKEVNAALPESIDEQVEATYAAYQEGASIVHIHARNPENLSQTIGDKDVYSRINSRIREKCPDIIINNSTGGGPHLSLEQKMACVFADEKPDMASLNPGPIMGKIVLKERKAPLPHPRSEEFHDVCLPMTYGNVTEFAAVMKEYGVKPEIELFHHGHYWVVQDLLRQGLVNSPCFIQFVMGFQTSAYPTPRNVLNLIDELPPGCMYVVAGLGPFQLPMNIMAIILGGHVRVGMEDNLYYRKGEPAESNAQLVSRVRRLAGELNRDVASPKEARKLLKLN